MRKLSVVIPNYNYGDFIGEAVRSALDLDWPDVEVIVVDDGSTDHSLAVLSTFSAQITVIVQENQGPRVACNRGFEVSTGDMVIFLDSDDVLEPTIANEVARVWREGMSKVQVQMHRIDGRGAPAGRPFPDYRFTPTPEQVRDWMTRTSAYPTPPGSGNVYSRLFLKKLFPLDDRCGDATDSACLAAAPYLGDVVTILKPLVGYRVHGRNRSGLLTDASRFTRQIERAVQRQLFASELVGGSADASLAERARPLRRGRHLLQMRVAETRLRAGTPPVPGDCRRSMAWDCIATLTAPGWESRSYRLASSLWSLATLLAPRCVAVRLVTWRFS